MGSLVSTHNTKLLSEDNVGEAKGCNWQDGPTTCPLTTHECQKDSVIYVASVSTQNSTEHYTGLTGGTLKKRWYQHNTNLNNQDHRTKTTLSAHVWKLKDKDRSYEIQWDIMDRARTFNPINKKCRLCLKEIFYIMFKPESATLNSRNELYNTCRHRKQKLLNPKK